MGVEEYTIKWSEPVEATSFSRGAIVFEPTKDLKSWNRMGFYVVYVDPIENGKIIPKKLVDCENNKIIRRRMLYIGKSESSIILDRIQEEKGHEPVYDKIRNFISKGPTYYKVFAQAGIPRYSEENHKHYNDAEDIKKLYIDIEALLICTNYQKEPILNTMNKDSYNSDRHLIITNVGCDKIEKESRSSSVVE